MMYYFEPKDKIWAAGGTLQTWAGCRAIHRGQYETDRGQYATPCRISFAPFCCVLIRSSVFQQVGFLDEQYFAYVEDADFLYRCSRHNLTLWFIPQARLWHKVSSLTGDASPFSLRYGARNRIYFLKKHKPAATRWFYYLLLAAYYFLRYAFRLDSRQRCGFQLFGCVEGLRIPLNQGGSSSRGAE